MAVLLLMRFQGQQEEIKREDGLDISSPPEYTYILPGPRAAPEFYRPQNPIMRRGDPLPALPEGR